jgi:LPXTG-site transpeptidase (sortase) family protein
MLLGSASKNILFKIQGKNLEQDTPIATLKIPAISLSQKLYENGDINQHLIFLEDSAKPSEKGGNVIIAGHSGYGDIAYFKNLYQLQKGDDIWLTYQNQKYHYIVTSSYKVPKTGEVEIIRDSQKNTITLITCYGKNQQLIVIGEQKK